MTKEQIIWAASHDWFIRETKDRTGIVVRDDMKENGTQVFDNFRKLREWAGY